MSHRENLWAKVREVNATFSNVPRLTPREVKALQVPYVFVDCRTREEREVSMIDINALSIEEFEQQLDENAATQNDMVIICHCTVGIRSARFVVKHKNNVQSMYTMPGGILSWIDEGYPIFRRHEEHIEEPKVIPTTLVHVCLKEFVNLAPKEYECVYEVPPNKASRWPSLGYSSSWCIKKNKCAATN